MQNQPFQFPQDILRQIKCLRKISPNDRFPCFSCFDDQIERITCNVCDGQGYLLGSHPMVQFSEDFIEKKISQYKKQEETSEHRNNITQSQFISDDRIHNNTSIKIQPEDLTQSDRIEPRKAQIQSTEMSSQQEESNLKHFGYQCDRCDQNPILGPRYHCTTCENFDLCAKCYRKQHHEHGFEVIAENKKMKSIAMTKHQILSTSKNIRMSLNLRRR